MSKTHDKPALSAEQQAAIASIRARTPRSAPGPDELIDRGELDELVSQAQYIELRALMVRLRECRERMGLSLTDLSERTGLTRAAISRLETGCNLNPTLETLFRYTEGAGCGLEVHCGTSHRVRKGSLRMTSYRKRGKVWYFRITNEDGGKAERKGCTDRRVTEEMAREAESRIARIRGGLIDHKAERIAAKPDVQLPSMSTTS